MQYKGSFLMKRAPEKRHIISTVLSIAVSVLLLAVSGASQKSSRGQANTSSFAPPFRAGLPAISASDPFSVPSAPTIGLVMADFTGDTHPDLARIELDRVDSATANYWIEIRLTEGGGQLLNLTAPFGGLLVTPRDVTGDGNLDLIVHAAKTRALVAVFVNDGNGHFHRANTTSFVKSLDDVLSHFGVGQKIIYLRATPGFPESHVIQRPNRWIRPLLQKDRSLIFANYGSAPYQCFSSRPNRAPPLSA